MSADSLAAEAEQRLAGFLAKYEPGIQAQARAVRAKLQELPGVINVTHLPKDGSESVELILACTAIESIALFAGVILSVQAPLGRRALALAISIPTIYILNIARNGFVLMAYAYSWFGADSFDLAHNVIGKAGSVAALLAISYVVFLLLPELLATMDELAAEIRHPGGEAA